MEKKEKNWLIGGGIALGSIAAFFVGRHFFKKEMEKLEKESHQNQDQVKKAGANPEKLEAMLKETPDEEKFMKSIYETSRFNPRFEREAFNMRKCLSIPNVIHVRESDYRDRKYLDFLFEIPNYVTGDKYMRGPRISDYIRQFSDNADVMWAKYVKYSQYPVHKLEGYIAVEYTNPDYDPKDENSDETIPRAYLLDKSVYESFSDEKHDGLTKFYEALVRNELTEEELNKLSEWIKKQIADDLADKCSEDAEITFDFKYMYLAFKISFPMGENEKSSGVNLIVALNCLEYLLNNCIVTREGSRVEVPYDHVMIHAFNDDGEQDITWYYDTDQNGNIVSSQAYWD